MEVTLLLILIIQLMLLLICLVNFYKDPMDFGNFFMIIYFIFYAFPAWDEVMGWGLFLDNFSSSYRQLSSVAEGSYLLFITTLIMLTFYIGYFISKKTIPMKDRFNYVYSINNLSLKLSIFFLSIVWIAVFYSAFREYSGSFLLFISPSRKTGLFQSYYLRYIFKLLPQVILIILLINSHLKGRRIALLEYIVASVSLLAYSVTGQRREILVFAIFVLLIFIELKNENFSTKMKNKLKRKIVMFVGLAGIVFTPVLWWLRVIASQLQRGVTDIVMPWEIRGFTELVFGSGATGFKMLLLVRTYIDDIPNRWGYNIFVFLSSFVPRSIWANKPLPIPDWLERYALVGTNPSLFYVNDMYVSFGWMSILASLFFGAIISFFYTKLSRSKVLEYKIYSFVIFANIITLFKNGVSDFLINVLFTIFISMIFIKQIFSKKKVRIEE